MKQIPELNSEESRVEIGSKEALLNVAEEMFAQHGFVATSTRMISKGAGVNLGNLHYYFRTKEALYIEVFKRHGTRLTDERVRLLKDATQRYQGGPVPTAELIRCFVYPFLFAEREPGGQAFVSLHCRLASEPADLAVAVRSMVYDASTMLFVKAFKEALPQLPEDVLYWRLHFLIGANAYTLARSGRLEFISDGRCSSAQTEEAFQQIQPFLEAGLHAPVPNSNKSLTTLSHQAQTPRGQL
jgi:AcrR family transcriptional regulator